MSTLSSDTPEPTSAVDEVVRRIKGVLLDRRQPATVLRGAALVFLIRGGGARLIYLSQVLLARWMAPTQFGIYAYAWSWAMLLAIPAGVGFSTASLRFIPEYHCRADWPRLAGYVRRAWGVTGVASVALGGAATATATAMAFFNVWLWAFARRRVGVDPSIIRALWRSGHGRGRPTADVTP